MVLGTERILVLPGESTPFVLTFLIRGFGFPSRSSSRFLVNASIPSWTDFFCEAFGILSCRVSCFMGERGEVGASEVIIASTRRICIVFVFVCSCDDDKTRPCLMSDRNNVGFDRSGFELCGSIAELGFSAAVVNLIKQRQIFGFAKDKAHLNKQHQRRQGCPIHKAKQ